MKLNVLTPRWKWSDPIAYFIHDTLEPLVKRDTRVAWVIDQEIELLVIKDSRDYWQHHKMLSALLIRHDRLMRYMARHKPELNDRTRPKMRPRRQGVIRRVW